MSKKFRNKMFSSFASLVMILNVIIPAFIPLQAFAQEAEATEEITQSISVDAEKGDWGDIAPIYTEEEETDENRLGNLYLHNDEEFLYFWVDANNIDNWGEEGQYINMAFQVNDEDSGNTGNPWNSNFNYSGMDNKPQYQLSLRIKNDKEIAWVNLADGPNEVDTVLDSDDFKNAEFRVNREVGFEGKIPLEQMGLADGDDIHTHVTLSGNNEEHGAFDVIPKVEGNAYEYNGDGIDEPNIQSVYTDAFTVNLPEDEETETPEEPETNEATEIEDGYFRIHFEELLSDDLGDNGLWIWDDVVEPSSDWPNDAASFSEATETDFGYSMDIELTEDPQKIGLLINTFSGSGQSEDIEFNLMSPEMNEAWVTSDWELFPYEPLTEENTIRVNYLRENDDYENWGLWTWEDVSEATDNWPQGAHDFDNAGKYGAYYDLPLAESPTKIGFKFLDKVTEEQTGDFSFEEFDHTQIFLREGDETVYTNPYFTTDVGVAGAELISETMIEIAYHSMEGLTEESLRESLTLTVGGDQEVNLEDYTLTINTDENVALLEGAFNLDAGTYTLTIDGVEISVKIGWRLKDALYAYDGDLGLDLRADGTATLKLWSPSADNVNVVLYDKDNQEEIVKDDIAMTQGDRGVWSVELTNDTTGVSDVTGYYYHFEIVRDGDTVLALDPYARSMAAWDNSHLDNYIGKAAIVNPSAVGPELDYANIPGYEKREDAIIYEAHVRDFTSDPEIGEELESQFGTFNAFVEKLDYIEDLGVTHIQLLPVMSYFFADEFNNDQRMLDYESTATNYNWGYDPQSYFSLTGMYSEDATDPAKRIEEFKQLIQEIHNRDMGIILDVVYNHTASMHIFEDLEPNYYHFMDADGTPREAFGGGRLGTTHEMSRRILVDSITYWVEEYNIDGFRFDMMGDHDAETIQIAYDEAAKLNPNVLMIGEGWVTYAGDEGDNVVPADQQWMDQTEAVGSFSDDMRNELKSGFGSEGEPRFLTGGARSVQGIYNNLTANPGNFNADNPGDVVPYIAAHDNLTLHDVIAQSIQKDPKDHQQEIHERIRLGNLMVLTAQGTPFIHAGQEYGRTKQFKHPDYKGPVDAAPYKSTFMTDEDGNPFEYPYFIHDSYDSTDIINRFDWAQATDAEKYPINTTTQSYTKGLIDLRRSTDAFSKGTMAEIDEHVSLVDVPEIEEEDLAIVYRAEDSNGEVYYIIVNTDNEERNFTLPYDLTNGEVLVDAETAGTSAIAEPEGLTINRNKVTMDPLSASIVRVTEEVFFGLYVEGDTEIEPGAETSFGVTYLNEAGERMPAEAEFALKTEIDGVTLDGNTLSVTEDVAPGTEIQMIITYEDQQTTYTVDVIGDTYEYTINYYRPDDNQFDWDMWLFGDGLDGEAYPFTETTTDGFAQATVEFELDEITLITRLGNWDQQENDRVISIPEGETAVEVWVVGGSTEVYYAKEDIEEVEQRYIQLTYVREDNDYEGWNIWAWNTGVQDDEILFDEVTEQGAVANIAVGPETTEIGYKIRYGDWEQEDPYSEDRFIQIDPNEPITKVTVMEGVGETHTVPPVNGPELEDGNGTFFYRNPELYLEDNMEFIDDVQLKITRATNPDVAMATFANAAPTFEMEYDSLNEYYVYTVEDLDVGDFNYSFVVTYKDEEVEEVEDPYYEASSFTYMEPEVSLEASIAPEAINYNQQAVVTIDSTIEEDAEFRRAYIDLTPVGGPAEVDIDLELMKHTIAVEQSVTAGVKTLDIVFVDEFGNRHPTEVEMEVETRAFENELDFDWDEARIYFMLTDRFSDGDPSNNDPNGQGYDTDHPESYHGGDFQGIIDNLDYLDDLGINTLWISPIVDNIDFNMREGEEESQYGYHGYWAKDFEKIDEHLGDLETFKELIDRAHDRGIKIMVDVVLNHTGYGMKGTDKFGDMLRENPVAGSDTLGELDGLPDFRTEEEEIRDQVIAWQTDWLERAQTDRGDTIDYFRVDTVKHVDNTTWNAFKNELTNIKPDFKMIGEWFGASVNNTGDQLRSGRMDSLLDFNFKNQAGSFIGGDIEGVEADLAARNGQIDNTAMLGQFLSSHDEDGFLVSQADGDEGLFKVAAALQMTAKGQPVIYYGEEIGMSGVAAGNMDEGAFSENRYDFDWDRVEDNDMLDHYQKLLNIRAEYSNVFSKGTRAQLAGSNDTGYSVFTRTFAEEQVFVGLNTNENPVISTFDVDLAPGMLVKDLYNDATYTVADDGTVTVEIPGNAAGGTAILVVDGMSETPEVPEDERIAELEDRLEELTEAIDALDAENEALVTELDAIREMITGLRGEAEIADADIADLESRIEALEALEASLGEVEEADDSDDTGDEGRPVDEGEAENESEESDESDESTEDEDTADEDDLPATGETENLAVIFIGITFIGVGLVVVFKFKPEVIE